MFSIGEVESSMTLKSPRWRYIVIAAGATALFVVAVFAGAINTLFLLGLILSLACILFLNSSFLIKILLVYLFVVVGAIEQLFGQIPREVFWLNYALIGVVFLKTIGTQAITNKVWLTPLFVPILLFIGWGLFTALLNDVAIFDVAAMGKDYIKYVLLFLVIANIQYSRPFLRKLVSITFVILILQAPITAYQYTLGISHWDQICGTFGLWGTGQLMLWVVIAISTLVCLYVLKKSRFSTTIIATSALLAIPFFGSARAIVFFLPVTLSFVLLHIVEYGDVRKLLKFFGGGIIALLLIFQMFDIDSNLFVSQLMPLGDAQSYLMAEHLPTQRIHSVPGRIYDLLVVVNDLSGDFFHLLTGEGMGSTKQAMIEASVLGGAPQFGIQSQIATSLREVGIIGIALYCFIIVRSYVIARRFLMHSADTFSLTIGCAAMAAILLQLIGSIYTGQWYNVYSSFLFWFLMGIVHSEMAHAQRTAILEKQNPVREKS